MDEKKRYRHEEKFYINIADRTQLHSRLGVIAEPDENAGPGGGYEVRSLYFDNYEDKAVKEKLMGMSRREKFRIRYYNGDTSFIRLEKKSKINRLCLKESAPITAAQCKRLLARDIGFMAESGNALFTELYAKTRYQNLAPCVIVDYYREAYVYRAGNVRITIDSSIRSDTNTVGFLSSERLSVPAAKAMILEIKYDGFLPDIIREAVVLAGRNETEFSKYVVSRLV